MSSPEVRREGNLATIEKGENILCMLSKMPSSHLVPNATADEEANGSDRSTEEFTWTLEEETAVRRKLDKVIVPLTTFLYLLCFLDRYAA